MQSTSREKQEHKYTGSIKLSGMPPFEFGTKAVSQGKAKVNGLAQYAKQLNMSIAALNSHLKKTYHEINIRVDDKR